MFAVPIFLSLLVTATSVAVVACSMTTATRIVALDYDPDPHETVWTSESAPEHDVSVASSPRLADPIAPCTPIEGGDVDPCERRLYDWWCCELYIYNNPSPWWPADVPWDAYERLSTNSKYGFHHAHSVVRATVIPGTTRCMPVSGWLFSSISSDFSLESVVPEYHPKPVQENCFVDVRVNEYLFARGPTELTLLLGFQPSFADRFDSVSEHREWIEGQFAQFEGYEYVLELNTPFSLLVRSWKVGAAWDVQRKSDGTVVAVDRLDAWYADQPDQLHKVELPLPELTRQVRRANDEKLARYNGRVGEGPNMPRAVQSMDDASLMDWMLSQDAWTLDVVATPMAPPPVRSPQIETTGLGDSHADVSAHGGMRASTAVYGP